MKPHLTDSHFMENKKTFPKRMFMPAEMTCDDVAKYCKHSFSGNGIIKW